MAAELIVLSTVPVFDAGAAESGATMTVYATGTTTPVTIYSDSGLTTAASNPLTANADGVFAPTYYDNSSTIRIVIKDSGGTPIQDIDPYLVGGGGSGSSAFVTVPDQTDYPYSIYVGDSTIPNLVSGGVGNNVLLGMDLLSSSYTGTDAINPDTGYGHTIIGTRIGSQNMTNNRDCVLIGYETCFFTGNANTLIAIGAKAHYGNTTRVTSPTPNGHAPFSGVTIGVTGFFEGLTSTSQKFVGIGNNVGYAMTRAFESVYIGASSGRYLGDTLYNVGIGSDCAGGLTDNNATNTTHTVAIGWHCLGALKNGTQNVVAGSNAAVAVQDGGRNVILGAGAGSDLSTIAGSAGANALVSGSNNTLVGNETEVSGAAASYQVAIGSGAAATANNQMMFGDTGRDHQYAFTNGYIQGKVYTFSNLPAATTAGRRVFVSDSDTAASGNFAATFAGGGANFVPAYSDGTNWRIG